MTDKTGKKQDNGRFQLGKSGNPAGRPHGVRNKASVLLDQLSEDAGEAILKRVIDMADRGDLRAADIILRRIWPEAQGRTVAFPVPPMQSAADAPAAVAAIIAAVGNGRLTPSEAHSLTSLVANYVRIAEAAVSERRLGELEEAADALDRDGQQ